MLSSQRVLGYLLEVFLEGKWGTPEGTRLWEKVNDSSGEAGPGAYGMQQGREPEGEESVPDH